MIFMCRCLTILSPLFIHQKTSTFYDVIIKMLFHEINLSPPSHRHRHENNNKRGYFFTKIVVGAQILMIIVFFSPQPPPTH